MENLRPQDLRVGNWVNNNEEDYQITSATIAQLERGDSTAKPIELTEQWLLRFGFKRLEARQINQYESEDIVMGIENGYYKVVFKSEWYGTVQSNAWKSIEFSRGGDYVANVETVHKLQNLYFILTDRELEIKIS